MNSFNLPWHFHVYSENSCKSRKPLWAIALWTILGAQLAESKLLWDLCSGKALAGNSSLSFILFVCVKFLLWPYPYAHPAAVLSIHQRATLCQHWLHPGGRNHIRVPPGSVFTSHLHLPHLLTGPLTRTLFYCTGKQKNTNAAPRFSTQHRERRVGWDWDRQRAEGLAQVGPQLNLPSLLRR